MLFVIIQRQTIVFHLVIDGTLPKPLVPPFCILFVLLELEMLRIISADIGNSEALLNFENDIYLVIVCEVYVLIAGL